MVLGQLIVVKKCGILLVWQYELPELLHEAWTSSERCGWIMTIIFGTSAKYNGSVGLGLDMVILIKS